MEKTKINVMDVISQIKIFTERDSGRLVRIILEENFNPSFGHHQIEEHLQLAGIGGYYFDGDIVGKESDYKVDLGKMDICYCNQIDRVSIKVSA